MPRKARVIPLVDYPLPEGWARLYTDGSIAHPGALVGAAAWLAVDCAGEPITWDVELVFLDHQLNNNAMELLAIQRGLEVLKRAAPGICHGVQVNTDSSAAVGLLWLNHQIRSHDTLMQQAYQEAIALLATYPLPVSYRMIKAHPSKRQERGILSYPYAAGNVIADALCTQAITGVLDARLSRSHPSSAQDSQPHH